MNKIPLSSPDESGWYFYKKNKKSPLKVVFVNEDGIGFFLDEEGENGELEDFIGLWEIIEPEKI